MTRIPIRLRVADVVERRRFCPRCDCELTEVDLTEVGTCTQCGYELEIETDEESEQRQ